MSISVSVPSCCRRRSSALNVMASPFRSNAWDRRRPPCRQRTRHRTAPFFRIRRSISTPLLPGSSSSPSRMPPHPDGHTRPRFRSTPGQRRRTLTGKPWARLPAPFLVSTWGAGSLAHRRAKAQVRRGCTGAQVCNRITHFVTHSPTHLNGSAAAPDALCAAHSRSRRQQLIGGCAFGTGTRAGRLDS
jgi:hypothetical protein